MSDRPKTDPLDEARRLLRADRTGLDKPRRARLRQNVERAIEGRRRFRWLATKETLVVLSTASALTAGLLFLRKITDAGEPPRRAHEQISTTLASEGTRPAHLRWLRPPEDLSVEAHEGVVHVRFTAGEGVFEPTLPVRELIAQTPHVSVDLTAARAVIRTDGEVTEIRVLAGRARLMPGRTARAVATPPTIEAGEVWRSRKPSPRPNPRRVMQGADRDRRQGRYRQAARAYGRVASHAWGGAYREEATLRWAEMLDAVGESRSALLRLAEAERRFPGGTLEPERRVLQQEISHRVERMIESRGPGN